MTNVDAKENGKYQTLKSINKSERRQVSSAVENTRRNYYFDKVST